MKNIKTVILIGILSLVFFMPHISFAALSVSTGTVDNVSDTGARLKGSATADPILKTTVYFRYSASSPIAPVFCNEIYGNDMVSTQDIVLNTSSNIQSFYQTITDLQPLTTYHYCAIVSTKTQIVYGHVQSFTTSPCSTCDQTTVTTKIPTQVDSSSATLRGSYTSTLAVNTYFEYKKDTSTTPITPTSFLLSSKSSSLSPSVLSAWLKVGDHNYSANTFGDVSFNLSGLSPNTKYDYVFKAETNNGAQVFTGQTLSFKTNASGGGTGLIDTTVESQMVTPNGGGVYSNQNQNPTLGTVATPPGDATVHYHEGIETVFARQIVANKSLAKMYGYVEGTDLQSFAWTLADFFAKVFGYVSSSGREIRVSQPDVAAYQIKIVANKLTIYEYYNSRIINIQSLTSSLKNTSGYEYYFRK